MENKRKTYTSTEVKRRYNDKVYSRITFSAPKDLVADFKQKCADIGVSQAQIFKEAMQKFIDDNN